MWRNQELVGLSNISRITQLIQSSSRCDIQVAYLESMFVAYMLNLFCGVNTKLDINYICIKKEIFSLLTAKKHWLLILMKKVANNSQSFV